MFLDLYAWANTLSLVFGGCCANALTLEQLTLVNPNFGSLITFLQFVLTSAHGLPRHVTWTRYGPRLKPTRVPLLPYLGQVSLFYLISLLNNVAFGYKIPMPIHIIFRSGGLVVSMTLGWLISKRRYNTTQVLAVLLVTAGVALTTLSASHPSSKISTESFTTSNPYTYATGIALLSLALLLSGFLGLLQDWTKRTYLESSPTSSSKARRKGKAKAPSTQGPVPWQESMFYLHFLGLPMFYPLLGDIRQDMASINYDSPRAHFNVPVPFLSASFANFFPALTHSKASVPPPYRLPSLDFLVPKELKNNSFIYPTSSLASTTGILDSFTISLPKLYLPLLLNTLTQLLCVAGVHKLTTRVSSLTVTLILVVRKAVSLVISLKGRVIVDVIVKQLGKIDYGQASGTLQVIGEALRTALGVDVELGKGKRPVEVNETMLWAGAALVLLGTIAYSIGTGWSHRPAEAKKGKTE